MGLIASSVLLMSSIEHKRNVGDLSEEKTIKEYLEGREKGHYRYKTQCTG